MKFSAPAIALALAGIASGCLVAPPRQELAAREGRVRAERTDRAQAVAEALDELLPRVLETLPGTRHPRLEVWVQDVPALYAFQKSAYSDADGFYAEGMQRIHLREGSEHLARTLAHELVHASLDDSWDTLPGTLEEGLCDVVSAQLVPDAAARLSAGRLSSAAFATGGLVIDVELSLPTGTPDESDDVRWSARMRLDGEPRVRVDPLRAFDVQAGLSTSSLSSAEKRSYYGVAFLVVRRIVERVGFEGLHELCEQASADGLAVVPTEVLLDAAGIDRSQVGLREAIEASIGARELSELVRAHPEFLVATIARFLGPICQRTRPGAGLDELRVRVRVAGSADEGLLLPSLESLRPRLAEARPDLVLPEAAGVPGPVAVRPAALASATERR